MSARLVLGFALLAIGCNAAVKPKKSLDACAALGACGILPALYGSMERCASYLDSGTGERLSAAQVDCLATAKADCAVVQRCVNDGTATCPDSCTNHVLTSCLDGNVPVQLDCSALGQMCVGATCGVGSCGSRDQTQCTGDRLDSCLNGVLRVGAACASLGAACVTAGDGSGQCVAAGAPACVAPIVGGLRCDGDVSVTCSGGHELRVDCAGSHCVANPKNGVPNSCVHGDECGPNFITNCNGSVLTFCDDGVITHYDCQARGFAGCDPSGRCTRS